MLYDYERETTAPMEWSWIWLWRPPMERYENTRIASERLWVNAVSGAFCLIINTTLLLTMIYRPSGHRNHKDDICIGANLLHDALGALQRLSFSIHASNVYAPQLNFVPTLHPYECFASLPAVLDSFLMPVCGTILLTTAIDRFMCVVKPVWYGYAGAEFAYGIQLMATVLAMPSILAQYLTAIFGDFRNAFIKADCERGQWTQRIVQQAMVFQGFLCAFISAVLYVPIFHRLYKTQKEQHFVTMRDREKLQTAATTALILVTYVMFIVVPEAIDVKSRIMGEDQAGAQQRDILGTIMALRGMVNTLIYVFLRVVSGRCTVRSWLKRKKSVSAARSVQHR
ncbi:hypothetical protein AAVH_10739 [Aphelenchoides avenae]|nr:hypothetical protein AAVH_10739 [Aphelenchus avenae]